MTRQTCIELGNSTAAAARPLRGDVIKKYSVPNTLSQAWYLGRAVHLARQSKMDFIEAIVSAHAFISHVVSMLIQYVVEHYAGQVAVYR